MKKTSLFAIMASALLIAPTVAQEDTGSGPAFRMTLDAPIFFGGGNDEQPARVLTIEQSQAYSRFTVDEQVSSQFSSPNAVGAARFEAFGLPAGMSMSTTGVLSGAAANQAPSSTIRVVATDDAGNEGELSFDADVIAKLGTLTASAPTNASGNGAVSFPVAVTGPNIAPETWDISPRPAWLSISGTGTGATVSGTAPNTTQSVSFSVVAKDIYGRDMSSPSRTIQITSVFVPTGCATIGSICSDGTRYVGTVDGKQLYAAVTGHWTGGYDQVTWQAATDQCGALTRHGQSDWRLPNNDEARYILAPSRYSANGYVNSTFWTSVEASPTTAYNWEIYNNNFRVDGKGATRYVACIRG